MLYQNQADTATETFSSISGETASFDTDLRVMSLYDIHYAVNDQENRRLIETLSYGCQYGGDLESPYSHVVSDSDEVIFLPREYTENHLNSSLGSNFRLEMDCDPSNPESNVVEIGEEPPENAEVIVRSVPVPLPYENITSARLYRWY